MSKPEIISKEPVSLSELKIELNAIQKRDTELNFRAGKTMEYVSQFKPLSKTAAQELTKKIQDLDVPRLKEEHVTKVLDFLPETAEELGVILQGYALTVSKENIKKIVDAVADYKKKKKE